MTTPATDAALDEIIEGLPQEVLDDLSDARDEALSAFLGLAQLIFPGCKIRIFTEGSEFDPEGEVSAIIIGDHAAITVADDLPAAE